ncbi:dethiobiotin synthase [Luteimonas sp. SJ-92]|uniref:ATP-dependent dethiobiotin synthetase BioD n=1 Tax=Luteimonas salinisoli TaxID=2752307 RepID=A0A853J9U6_9GAMM|nr:dethiobiotin synthase [Luteimonas salinisoli]NZA25552.1 dethiobiotin synthase [Luteimonas salinisoli]
MYVTGTDTGVGKTLASAALLYALRAGGRGAVGMKPVASGCEPGADGWRNADALALQVASDPRPPYADVNPYALPAATAPQLAAREAGIEVAIGPLLAAHARLATLADLVVVEGVGGWLAPLADGFEQSALVQALEIDVVLVVGLRLGCLNHARLSARAIADDGCRLAGWIGSAVDPEFERIEGYVQLIGAALPVPCLGVLPYMARPDAARAARALTLPL